MLTSAQHSASVVASLPLSGVDMTTMTAGFISSVCTVSLSAGPQLRALSCAFDVASYHDSLFDRLRVMLPDQIKGAVVKRKAEFLAGRYLCRLLLETEGLHGQVLIGEQRQPIWPAAYLGSITHSANQAMVALWPNQNGRVLGLDLENWMTAATAKTIENQIALPGELDRLNTSWPREHLLTLTFSAKESLYKALFAKVGVFFDFHSAQLCEMNEADNTFILRLTQSLPGGFDKGDEFAGRYLAGSQQALTWIASNL